MITIEVPFSLNAIVGDVTIEDVISGQISVNLYDDAPEDDEINGWRCKHSLPFALSDKMERVAIDEARRMHRADLDAVKIANAE